MPILANDKHERFCQEYLVDFNASQAAIRAGYSKRSAGSQAHDLLKKPDIQARLAELKAEIAAKLEIDQEAVFRRWWETATADPNELTQHRRGACRYCHGADFHYQWKTLREFTAAYDLWEAREPAQGASRRDVAEHNAARPIDDGGYAYRLTNDPNPDCPECEGLGVPYVYLADTRTLSPQARLLFSGVKETRHGVEIIMADQQKNLELVARRLGMLKDEVKHDVTDRLAELVQSINRTGSAAPIRSGKK